MNGGVFLEQPLNRIEVEWKPLGQLGELVRGNGLPKSDFTESGVPAIHYGQIYTYYGLSTRSTISFVSAETAATLKRVDTGDVVITNTSENPEDIGKALVYLGQKAAVTGGHATIFKSNGSIVGMYFGYLTKTPFFEYAKRKFIKGSKVFDLSAKDMAKIEIPIPCPWCREKSLAIQGQIVRILNSFTEQISDLITELDLRKKQYSHYRDRLLASENAEVEWLSMKDIGEFIRGKRFTKADYRPEGVRAIHYGEIYTHYGVFAYETLSKVRADMANSLRFADKNDVIMTGVSETVEDVGKAVAWLGEGKVAIHDDSYAFRHTMNPKYIAYAMQTNAFHDQKGQFVSRGKIKRLLIDGMERVKLPIPFPNDPKKSLAEQARVVAILDMFNTLTTSLSDGLPHEIALRQKQYEYYRDLILSFPNPAEQVES